MSELKVVQIKKRYKSRVVVADVSLEVRSGEVIGLLGPNGAGKTTCFYMMVGLVPLDGGEIYLDDKRLTHMPIHKRALLGLSFDPNALDQQGVLRAISALRDGRAGQASVGAQAFFAARDPVRFKNIKQCTMVDAPATETFLIQLSTAGFLGFRPRLHYALVSQRASGELTLLALSEPQKA